MTSNDIKRPRMTPNNLAKPETKIDSTVKRTSNKRNKNILKAGSVLENIEVTDDYLDEILHEKNI